MNFPMKDNCTIDIVTNYGVYSKRAAYLVLDE